MATTLSRSPGTTGLDHAAPDLAPLSDEDIAKQTDSGSFSRGKTYFRGGRIYGAVRRENTLRARCHGSSGGPYTVEATLATVDQAKKRKNNPVDFACDCPRGGFCKHVVALLLTWIDNPETFVARPPIGEILAGKSQSELIALIELMLAEDPDLEELLELPVLTAGGPGDAPIEETVIRRQVETAFRDDDGHRRYGRYEYDDYFAAAGRIAGKLERLFALADGYVESGDWSQALLVAATLVEEIAPRIRSVEDQHGDLSSLLSRADDLLARCLDAQQQLPAQQRMSDQERRRLIDAILTIWQADLDIGGADLSGEGPEAIGLAASPEEQQRVADWLRKSMTPAADSGESNWQNQARIGFLSLLSGEAGLSDEQLLEEYRHAELWEDVAALLVEMDRADEAVAIAARRLRLPHALTTFADKLIATGDPARITQALSLVDDRLWEQEGQNPRFDQMLGEWLERRYVEHNQPQKGLELARDRFAITPSRSAYVAVKNAALHPGQPGDPWPALRKELLAVLRKRRNWYAVIDIHLEDGEIAEAIAALAKSEKSGRTVSDYLGDAWNTTGEDLDVRVAVAAEADFPDDAIRIYGRLAEQRIGYRERANYRTAAGYLARVKALLEANGRAGAWPPLIADLRERHKTLRALREELDAVGLE